MKHLAIFTALALVVAALAGCGEEAAGPSQIRGTATPLHKAARAGDRQEVGRLLYEKADVNARDDRGRSALKLAAMEGHADIVTDLLKAGADQASKNEALQMAASNGHVGTVETLLSAGAEVNATLGYGRTALHGAVYKTKTAVVQLLIEKGADVKVADAAGVTPLHNAAGKGSIEIATLLIEAGADVNAPDSTGSAPLSWANQNDQHAAAAFLRQHGAR